MAQAPVVVSQQTRGCGQVFGEQDAAAEAMLPAAQGWPGRAIEQAPVVVSQQTVGCGHGLGVQVFEVEGILPSGQSVWGGTTMH